jgi:uncharacterized protein (TIGR01777 family)
MPHFQHQTYIPHPPGEVFAWHLQPSAFQRLQAPWIQVRVLKVEGGIQEGGRMLLGVRQGPTEIKWGFERTRFEAGTFFQDEQVSGPFGKWVHAHRFKLADDGGCFVEDEVEWDPPLGAAGRVFGEGFIQRELERFFAFRHIRLRNDLALHGKYSGEPLTVAITGSSGLIGRTLTQFLLSGGHQVRPMVRRDGVGSGEGIPWDPQGGKLDPAHLEGVDAVVHLAGEPLSAFRWSEEKKTRILSSRVEGTGLIARTLAKMAKAPTVLVSASAVGIYGNRGNEVVTEETNPGRGFLAMVCREWEAATAPARKAGIRVVKLRTGFVVSPEGPGLGKMLPPFKAGLGGRIGSGRQYVSWIDLDDEVGLIHHALIRPGVAGPLNATAPNPVPNSAFADTLGRVLGRPTLVPLPSLAVKALLGELGEELLLKGARVVPKKAEETGYEFLFPSLEDSLRFQLGKPEEE